MENRSNECACSACCLRCVDRHSTMAFNINFNLNGLSFFMVMHPNSTSFLEIPWKFAGKMKDGYCGDALLMGQNGKLWRTKLCFRNGVAKLRDGWEKFFHDHSLNSGDVIVFKHVNNALFIVQIFVPNGHEKRCVIKEQKEIGGIFSVKDEKNEDTAIITVEAEEEHPFPLNISSLSGLAVEMGANVSQLSFSPLNKRKMDKIHQTAKKGKLGMKKIAAEVSAKLVITDNPKFEKDMAESSVTGTCRLSIPKEFSEKWLKNVPDVILKSREQSGTWLVKIQSYPRFCGFTGGWRSFVEAHHLEEADICVFELIESKHAIFKVYVYKFEELYRQRLLEM